MNIITAVNNYWQIILFLAGLIFHVIWTYFTVGSHEKKISLLQTLVDDHAKISDDFREEIKVDIKEIKTSILFIREMMAQARKK